MGRPEREFASPLTCFVGIDKPTLRSQQTKETPRDVAQRMNYTSVVRFIDMYTGAGPPVEDGEDEDVAGEL